MFTFRWFRRSEARGNAMGAEGIVDQIKRLWTGAPELTQEQRQALSGHFELLGKWNPKINLVGSSTLATAAEKHYAEGLFLAARLPEGVCRVVDCGSGAGFPGFPLAVLRPDVHVTLLEADRRKAAFLREACHMKNVAVRTERLEQVGDDYDAAITRAVDPAFVIGWASSHAARFGFIGATQDVAGLSDSKAFCSFSKEALPWKASSSILWAMFHVKHP
jgi:16S rRNA G527 N7-methylase RsmG